MTRPDDLERRILTMGGGQLLEELITHAANNLEQVIGKGMHLFETTSNFEAIRRAIQTRLAETGIARKHHSETCRFMLGDDRCRCSDAAWSWPRNGMPGIE